MVHNLYLMILIKEKLTVKSDTKFYTLQSVNIKFRCKHSFCIIVLLYTVIVFCKYL